MSDRPLIRHLVIIGTGLIGGSLALALRRAGAVGRVTGVGRSLPNLELARARHIIDDLSRDAGEAVGDADMIVLAVPVGAYGQVLEGMAGSMRADAVLTDVGSTKQSAIDAVARSGLNASRFVPGHPIAGTESSGAAAAFAELFERRHCILTPTPETDTDALARVEAMWRLTGAHVLRMTAAEHDRIMAAVSHLPHLAAFALVNAVREAGRGQATDPFDYAAGGFRDFTRIASSSPEMWRDIALMNREPLLRELDRYRQCLDALGEAIEREDGEALLRAFAAAKQARDAWLKEHGGEA